MTKLFAVLFFAGVLLLPALPAECFSCGGHCYNSGDCSQGCSCARGDAGDSDGFCVGGSDE